MTERIIKRIEEATDDETAYEAQQQLKSVYHRLRSRQKLKEAYELLYKGCTSHIACGQVRSCAGSNLFKHISSARPYHWDLMCDKIFLCR